MMGIKTAGQMNTAEMAKAEELYQRYMEGQRHRIPSLHIHISFDFGTSFTTAIEVMKDLHGRLMIIGGMNCGKTAIAMQISSLFAERPVVIRREMDDDMIKRRLEVFHGFHRPEMFTGIYDAFEQLKELSSMASKEVQLFNTQAEKIQRLEDYDEPVNFCHGEHPPKQKKFRSYVPDKRAINRRNRKSKRK